MPPPPPAPAPPRSPGDRRGASPRLARRLGLLGEPAFVGLWAIGTLGSTVRWLEMLAAGVWVYDVTGSPLLVASMLVLRMLPLALLGAFAGALAERLDRVLVLRVGLGAMAAVSAGLWVLAAAGRIEVWHVGAGALLGGVFWVTDFPVRRTLVSEVAGPERLGRAMSLDTLTNNGTRMLGPLAGGLLLQVVGLDGAYLLGAAAYAAALGAALALPVRDRHRAPATAPVLASVAAGIRHLRGDRTLTGLLVVTVVFNLWGFPFVSMIPVIGKNVLGLDAFPVGLLASAEGAGAFLGALLITLGARLPWYRRLYAGGVALYLTMAIAFSHSPWPVVSGLVLVGAGLGGAAFASMQSTLVMLSSPPEVRARMMGVLSVCIGTGPIGFLHLGLLADWLGAPGAVALVGLEGLAAMAFALRRWPEIVAVQPAPR